MDLILTNARVAGVTETDGLVDIGIGGGQIAHLGPRLQAEGRQMDLAGALVAPGFVETHIHLDKSRLLDRCRPENGTHQESIAEGAVANKKFTPDDAHRL